MLLLLSAQRGDGSLVTVMGLSPRILLYAAQLARGLVRALGDEKMKVLFPASLD